MGSTDPGREEEVRHERRNGAHHKAAASAECGACDNGDGRHRLEARERREQDAPRRRERGEDHHGHGVAQRGALFSYPAKNSTNDATATTRLRSAAWSTPDAAHAMSATGAATMATNSTRKLTTRLMRDPLPSIEATCRTNATRRSDDTPGCWRRTRAHPRYTPSRRRTASTPRRRSPARNRGRGSRTRRCAPRRPDRARSGRPPHDVGSRPFVGSSRNNSSGLHKSSFANASFCCCPPDKS